MRFTLYFFSISLLLFFISCNNGVELIVINKRNSTLKNIQIGNNDTNATITINALKRGESFKGFLSFKNTAKADGAYWIKINNSGNIKDNFGFGYYSNGMTLAKRIQLTLYNDTTIIDTKTKD